MQAVAQTYVVVALTCLMTSCVTRPIADPPNIVDRESAKPYPLTLDKDVDLLFVIDSSNSMNDEQDNLIQNFGVLVEALRTEKLGPEPGNSNPCGKDEAGVIHREGCQIPNVRIGVVSTHLGMGKFSQGSVLCDDSDEGKLLNVARTQGCPTPGPSPWIEHSLGGVTNVPVASGQSTIDAVKKSFECIAKLGIEGCDFEQPLEAAYRALDEANNPGFQRSNALLVIVFITDEDDCSAQNDELFNGSRNIPGEDGYLGPQLSFRCFNWGIECDGFPIGTHFSVGGRNQCKPAVGAGWLYDTDRYINFFKGLRPAGRVLVAAITGPVTSVSVEQELFGGVFVEALAPSCQTPVPVGVPPQGAVPAIRIKTVVDAFGDDGQLTSICEGDFGPALQSLGDKIRGQLGGQCIDGAPIVRNGEGVVCSPGIEMGNGRTCQKDCLAEADCIVREGIGSSENESTLIPRCAAELFNPEVSDCGQTCPCWRLVYREGNCDPTSEGSPFSLEILRTGEPPSGATAFARCRTALQRWGTNEFAALDECK